MRTCLSANFPVIREFAGNFCDLQGIWTFEPIGNALGSAGPRPKFPTQRTGNFLSGIGEVGEVSSEILRPPDWPSMFERFVGFRRRADDACEVHIMPYVSDWELLSDAATRVMEAAGVSKEEAQSDICQAIADRAVKFGAKLERHTTKGLRASKTVLEGTAFQIPTAIKPKDLDWERSRPVKPWFVQRGISTTHGYWDLEWIQLSRTDVTNVLCRTGTRGELPQPTSSETGARRKSGPKLESAQRAIRELFPEGVPGQAVEPNSNLCRRVGEKLKEQGLPDVSNDTILRAAGRRK